jgi:hypothetical protein
MSQKSDTWQFQDVQAVQVVQAFAQTVSRVKKVTRGSFKMFRLFRLFRLLRKLFQESNVFEARGTWHFQDVQDLQAVQAFTQTFSPGKEWPVAVSRCSACSDFCTNFLTRAVQGVQAVQAFTQTFSRDKVSMTRGSTFQDVEDVQAVQAFTQTFSRGKEWHVAVSECSACSNFCTKILTRAVQDVQIVQAFTQIFS